MRKPAYCCFQRLTTWGEGGGSVVACVKEIGALLVKGFQRHNSGKTYGKYEQQFEKLSVMVC